MTDQTPIAERTAKLEGIGCRRKRVEDVRFVQGKGNYVDDIVMPGMLFGDFVRSPFAHARIKSIKKDAALALPGVKAVLTAADLIPLNLHYMPTLAGDVQAVLAHREPLGHRVRPRLSHDRRAGRHPRRQDHHHAHPCHRRSRGIRRLRRSDQIPGGAVPHLHTHTPSPIWRQA